jgi:hypothetical protein
MADTMIRDVFQEAEEVQAIYETDFLQRQNIGKLSFSLFKGYTCAS